MTQTRIWRGMGLVALLLLTGTVSSDDKTAAKKPDKTSNNAEMEAMMKAAMPGPEHKRLDEMAGSWTYTMKMWLEPGQPPSESKGTAENKWILDGRFLVQDVSGTFMGMPFFGHGINGYDNIQKKYIGVWMDSYSTGFSHSVGSADASGKVITFTRDELDPGSGKKVKSKDVVRIVDHDHYEMDMYKDLGDGKELKVIEMRSTRKK